MKRCERRGPQPSLVEDGREDSFDEPVSVEFADGEREPGDLHHLLRPDEYAGGIVRKAAHAIEPKIDIQSDRH